MIVPKPTLTVLLRPVPLLLPRISLLAAPSCTSSTALPFAKTRPWHNPDWPRLPPSTQLYEPELWSNLVELQKEKADAKLEVAEAAKREVQRDLREERQRSGFYEFRMVFGDAREMFMSECGVSLANFEGRPVDLWKALLKQSGTLRELLSQVLAPYPRFLDGDALAFEIVRLHQRLSSSHHRLVFARDRTFLLFPTL
ncbi:hypothetical protein M427DRAFT_52230 [Gonapodya prolifera JEL478]|uniref:Uncharacterized protein n=1 Tax=Gonapodya prolifera (strain JEL478) TaxID=1344416 RepID=A0A139AVC0_GONPJ|nr:hypothetical protein M427DRAFT_52230 [Gonapodya prolifera JEL478]|eukprot:KXS20644.1 hypothetical protein M427DRAFT_52230 [Gonapodya prolifera JEL478]